MFKTDRGLTACREVHFLKFACLLCTWLGLKSLCPWWGDKTHRQSMAQKQLIGNQEHLFLGFNQGLAMHLPPGLTGTLRSSKRKSTRRKIGGEPPINEEHKNNKNNNNPLIYHIWLKVSLKRQSGNRSHRKIKRLIVLRQQTEWRDPSKNLLWTCRVQVLQNKIFD